MVSGITFFLDFYSPLYYFASKLICAHRSPTNASCRFSLAVAGNTTSPPLDQMNGFARWSREESTLAYSHTGLSEFLCPTVLFLEIMEISRQRTAIATHGVTTTTVRRVEKIARAVRGFDAENWKESYSTEDPKSILTAKLFKCAVTLYAILSLPTRFSAAFADTPPRTKGKGSKKHRPREIRSFYRDQMFELFEEAFESLARYSLGWPTAVLGVAVVDNPKQKAQFEKWLGELMWMTGSDGGMENMEPVLKDFWTSGKTGWNDCFTKPISALV